MSESLAKERQRILDDFAAPFKELEERIDQIVDKINARVQASDDACDEIREEDGKDEEDDA
jgi:hypothetical protein